MAVTLKDIAERVGVSSRLVSYALNGEPGVGPAMRQRISDTAAEMGYKTNRAARALVTGRTQQIALCVPSLNYPFHLEFIRHFESFARGTAYDLLICTSHGRQVSSSGLAVDGVLLYDSNLLHVKDFDCPKVILQSPPLNERKGDREFDRVTFELNDASRDMMAHLLGQGLKRIAFVTFNGILLPCEPRYAYYLEAMEKAGLSPEVVRFDYDTSVDFRPLTHRALREYFAVHGFPEALFCCNDEIAIGAYRALREERRRIPEETVVVGCDDIPEVADTYPPLTTIRHPWEKICRSAWDMLMARIENPQAPFLEAHFESELIVRQSSAGVSEEGSAKAAVYS